MPRSKLDADVDHLDPDLVRRVDGTAHRHEERLRGGLDDGGLHVQHEQRGPGNLGVHGVIVTLLRPARSIAWQAPGRRPPGEVPPAPPARGALLNATFSAPEPPPAPSVDFLGLAAARPIDLAPATRGHNPTLKVTRGLLQMTPVARNVCVTLAQPFRVSFVS